MNKFFFFQWTWHYEVQLLCWHILWCTLYLHIHCFPHYEFVSTNCVHNAMNRSWYFMNAIDRILDNSIEIKLTSGLEPRTFVKPTEQSRLMIIKRAWFWNDLADISSLQDVRQTLDDHYVCLCQALFVLKDRLSPSCIDLSFDGFGSISWHSIWYFRLFPTIFGLPTFFRPKYHWRDFSSRNAHLVHQYW
jgi:hypothetical protein